MPNEYLNRDGSRIGAEVIETGLGPNHGLAYSITRINDDGTVEQCGIMLGRDLLGLVLSGDLARVAPTPS